MHYPHVSSEENDVSFGDSTPCIQSAPESTIKSPYSVASTKTFPEIFNVYLINCAELLGLYQSETSSE